MAKIGFLGLVEMGTPMAGRLLQAGHEVVVWNRSPERHAAKDLRLVTQAAVARGRDLKQAR